MMRLSIDCPTLEAELVKLAGIHGKSPEGLLASLFAEHAMGVPNFNYDALPLTDRRPLPEICRKR